LTDVIPEPSKAQLHAFYGENKEQSLTSPSCSFEHIYFSFARTKLPENPDQFINRLQSLEDVVTLGEFSLLGNRFSKASFQSVALSFGKPLPGTYFYYQPIHVPFRRLAGEGLPVDGGDVCSMPIGQERRSSDPVPGCRPGKKEMNEKKEDAY
jgi:hypothetical protein